MSVKAVEPSERGSFSARSCHQQSRALGPEGSGQRAQGASLWATDLLVIEHLLEAIHRSVPDVVSVDDGVPLGIALGCHDSLKLASGGKVVRTLVRIGARPDAPMVRRETERRPAQLGSA